MGGRGWCGAWGVTIICPRMHASSTLFAHTKAGPFSFLRRFQNEERKVHYFNRGGGTPRGTFSNAVIFDFDGYNPCVCMHMRG